jgi:hypothetical protein
MTKRNPRARRLAVCTHFIPLTFRITVTDETGTVVHEASYAEGGEAHLNHDARVVVRR